MKVIDSCKKKKELPTFYDLPAGTVFKDQCGKIRIKIVWSVIGGSSYCISPEGTLYPVTDPIPEVTEVYPDAALHLNKDEALLLNEKA